MAYNGPNDYRHAHNGGEPEELEARLEHTRAEIDDTLAELERKLTPGDLLDEAIDYLRDHGPGPFITELAGQLKDHPLPAALSAVGAAWATKRAAKVGVALARKPLPTALTAVGLAWFMMAESRGRGRESGTEDYEGYGERGFSSRGWSEAEGSKRLRRFGRKLRAGAKRFRSGAAETAEELRERASVSTHQASHVVRDAGATAAHTVENAASQAVHTAAAAAAGVKRAAGGAFETTREVARTAAESSERITHAAREYTSRGKERTMQAAAELEDTIRRHPLVTAMFLAAAGAVCAAMLPSTQRESELFGETGEELKREALETARMQLERGKRVASAAVEGAIEGAKERAAEVAGEAQQGQGQRQDEGH